MKQWIAIPLMFLAATLDARCGSCAAMRAERLANRPDVETAFQTEKAKIEPLDLLQSLCESKKFAGFLEKLNNKYVQAVQDTRYQRLGATRSELAPNQFTLTHSVLDTLLTEPAALFDARAIRNQKLAALAKAHPDHYMACMLDLISASQLTEEQTAALCQLRVLIQMDPTQASQIDKHLIDIDKKYWMFLFFFDKEAMLCRHIDRTKISERATVIDLAKIEAMIEVVKEQGNAKMEQTLTTIYNQIITWSKVARWEKFLQLLAGSAYKITDPIAMQVATIQREYQQDYRIMSNRWRRRNIQ